MSYSYDRRRLAAGPGPLLEQVRKFIPAWTKQLSQKTEGHTFRASKPKKVRRQGQQGLRVVLESQYDKAESLDAVFMMQPDQTLDLTVTHRGKSRSYQDVSPQRLPEDQLIHDLKIDLGPETPVWVGLLAVEEWVVSLDRGALDNRLRSDFELSWGDQFDEVWGSEREVMEHVERYARSFNLSEDEVWDMWDEDDPRLKEYVKAAVMPAGSSIERKPLKDIYPNPSHLDDALQALRRGEGTYNR